MKQEYSPLLILLSFNTIITFKILRVVRLVTYAYSSSNAWLLLSLDTNDILCVVYSNFCTNKMQTISNVSKVDNKKRIRRKNMHMSQP